MKEKYRRHYNNNNSVIQMKQKYRNNNYNAEKLHENQQKCSAIHHLKHCNYCSSSFRRILMQIAD